MLAVLPHYSTTSGTFRCLDNPQLVADTVLGFTASHPASRCTPQGLTSRQRRCSAARRPSSRYAHARYATGRIDEEDPEGPTGFR
jgi:hypothetical protein